MRKSFDGLVGLVKHQLQEDPLSGHLFVFINRKRTYLKILYFDRSGYCIWAKRLERGHFTYAQNQGLKQSLDWTRLKLILEGIELDKVRQQRRYIHSSDRSVMIE